MQEVEGFLNGTLDYQYLKGDTGPLVNIMNILEQNALKCKTVN